MKNHSVSYEVSTDGGANSIPTTSNQSGLADVSYLFRALVADAAGNSSTFNAIATSATSNQGTAIINAAGHSIYLDAARGNKGFTVTNATYDAAVTLLGSRRDDILTGGTNGDTIIGGSFNDTLTGYGGADTLSGGSDKDVFVYTSLSDSTSTIYDRIIDFQRGQDLINFTSIQGINSVQGLISASATINADSIAWTESGRNTLVFVITMNLSEAQSSAQMQILLVGTGMKLTSGDFQFI